MLCSVGACVYAVLCGRLSVLSSVGTHLCCTLWVRGFTLGSAVVWVYAVPFWRLRLCNVPWLRVCMLCRVGAPVCGCVSMLCFLGAGSMLRSVGTIGYAVNCRRVVHVCRA